MAEDQEFLSDVIWLDNKLFHRLTQLLTEIEHLYLSVFSTFQPNFMRLCWVIPRFIGGARDFLASQHRSSRLFRFSFCERRIIQSYRYVCHMYVLPSSPAKRQNLTFFVLYQAYQLFFLYFSINTQFWWIVEKTCHASLHHEILPLFDETPKRQRSPPSCWVNLQPFVERIYYNISIARIEKQLFFIKELSRGLHMALREWLIAELKEYL